MAGEAGDAPGADDDLSGEEAAEKAEALVSSWPLARAEEVARAFAVFFHLVNLAEEYHRKRIMQRSGSDAQPASGGVGAAVEETERLHGAAHGQALLAGLTERINELAAESEEGGYALENIDEIVTAARLAKESGCSLTRKFTSPWR